MDSFDLLRQKWLEGCYSGAPHGCHEGHCPGCDYHSGGRGPGAKAVVTAQERFARTAFDHETCMNITHTVASKCRARSFHVMRRQAATLDDELGNLISMAASQKPLAILASLRASHLSLRQHLIPLLKD